MPTEQAPRSPARGFDADPSVKPPSVVVYATNDDAGAALAATEHLGKRRLANPKYFDGTEPDASRALVYPTSPNRAAILAAYEAAGVPVGLVGAPPVETAKAAPAEAPAAVAPSDLPAWGLKTTPRQYLAKYGDDKPKSRLAQQYIDAGRPGG